MKANELMIGDWVKTNDLYKAIKDVKVRAISQYSVQDETTSQWIECQHIEPIPLTAEILEKNGFIRQQLGYFRYENEDNYLAMVFYPKEKNYTLGGYDYIDIFKGRITLRGMPISCVHELQHILKDCRIDKEIVL